ncbi:Spondin [Gracilaria domingensis]|nr:Spondin [Gracilaria domingensis]
MIRHLAFLFLSLAVAQASPRQRMCTGEADYVVNFTNLLTPERFGDAIPEGGLVYSPLAGASHSNRISLLTVRSLASPQVEQIAETGDNGRFVALAEGLVGKGVKNVSAAMGPTMPGNYTALKFTVDCEHPFITVVSMIAPSPDWLVQISNINLVRRGSFIKRRSGRLIAYDAGTDDGGDFTNPADASLDMPTEPQLNIAPLVEDETDAFDGRFVGKYVITKV